MRTFYLFFLLTLFSCSSQKSLEIEVTTEYINSLNVSVSEYGSQYIKMDTLAVENSRTRLTFKITNYSNKTYYFNVLGYQESLDGKLMRDKIKINNALLSIYDKHGKPVMARASQPSLDFDSDMLYSRYLNYDHHIDLQNKNFIIHPDETLYFEWFVVLPFGNLLEDTNYSVILDEHKEYFAKILIGSTSNLEYISRTDLETIKENKYEIFDGIITSKNRVPIRINNP